MSGGWCPSLKDARVSLQPWERSANGKQQDGLFFRETVFSFVVFTHHFIPSQWKSNNTTRSEEQHARGTLVPLPG